MALPKINPAVMISRDGALAIELLSADGPYPIHDRGSISVFFTCRINRKAAEDRIGVAFASTVSPVDDARRLQLPAVSPDTLLLVFAEAAITEYLDAVGLPEPAQNGKRPAYIECDSEMFNTWLTRPPASDVDCVEYMERRMYRTWQCNHLSTVFGTADALSLGVPQRTFERLAQRGLGINWTAKIGGSSAVILVPLTPLLDRQEALLSVPTTSDVAPIPLLLAPPRYAAPLAHWRKSVGFAEAAQRDLANAAKEAVSAVEGLAQIVTNTARATLGESIKNLQKRGVLSPPLAKSMEGLWAFANNSPGVRHGSSDPVNITPEQARYVLDTSAAAIRLLLVADT